MTKKSISLSFNKFYYFILPLAHIHLSRLAVIKTTVGPFDRFSTISTLFRCSTG